MGINVFIVLRVIWTGEHNNKMMITMLMGPESRIAYTKWSNATKEFDAKMQMILMGEEVDRGVLYNDIVKIKGLFDDFMNYSKPDSEE